jgi:phospholipid-binding lipoprotein MlaA
VRDVRRWGRPIAERDGCAAGRAELKTLRRLRRGDFQDKVASLGYTLRDTSEHRRPMAVQGGIQVPYRGGVVALAILIATLVAEANAGALPDGQPEGQDAVVASPAETQPQPLQEPPTSDQAVDPAPTRNESAPGVRESAGAPDPGAFSRVSPEPRVDVEAQRPVASEFTLDTSLSELEALEAELEEYDPWSGFNERTFAFNYNLDRYVVKPVARAWDKVVPNFVQRGIHNLFQNVGSVRRLINTALQGRFDAFGQELGRFVINTVFGVGGFIDAAPSFGVAPRAEADAGQTLAVWGIRPGPYLVLPFFPPSSVRDTTGTALDIVMNPLTWIIPSPFFVGAASQAGNMINERSMNLELFEDVEESVLDLYSSVRNAFFQRRQRLVQEALADSPFGRRERLILTSPPTPLGAPEPLEAETSPPPSDGEVEVGAGASQ